ncbi:cold-shock protein [Nocardia sp. NEAU-351]|uniref:Cold-shock protein n=2 Tax=Nocardia bovistercoris TaxID=2785916 RepID=A0A931N2I3_9NOCA|nr:cold-shock protein [Nocardia bovistercoris]
MSSSGPVALSSQWRLGTVAWFDGPKGFGFIQPVGDREAPVFVEHSCIDTPGYRVLVEGRQVLFRDRGGRPQAAVVRPVTGELANCGDLANVIGQESPR